MKEKILALLGFPPPTSLYRVHTPWKDGMIENDDHLLIDGRNVKDEKGLQSFFVTLQDGVKQLAPNGKLLIYGLRPEELDDTAHATFQQSLVGIVRSLAKEMGSKGATVNLLRLPLVSEVENRLVPEQFFTTGRSAFITGQVQLLDNAAPSVGSLAEKVCAVTGGAGGIGSATVKRLAAEGATVIIVDMPQMEEKASALLNDHVFFVGADLTDAAARKKLLDHIKDAFGRLDVLINNAGITRDKTLKRMPPHYWDQVIAINLSAVTGLTEQALDMGLIPEGGRIISTSSISGIAGNFGQTNYTATKAALIGYTAKKSTELMSKGITVNAVAPGFIATNMVKTMPMMTRIFAERLTCLAQAGKPEDIAEAMTFLAHPGSQAVNGQVLRVCGGSFLGA